MSDTDTSCKRCVQASYKDHVSQEFLVFLLIGNDLISEHLVITFFSNDIGEI